MTETLQQPEQSVKSTIRPLDFGSILEDLDNFELTPVQFRVYCHLLREIDSNGTVSKSSESIARACNLTRITVLRVLVQLEKLGMVLCDRTIGKKTVYSLQPSSSWCCVQPNAANSRQSKIISFPMSATSKPEIPVNEINTHQEEQVTPFKGVTCPPPVAGANQVNEVDRLTALAGFAKRMLPDGTSGRTGGKSELELTLEQKLEACRQMGCNAGQVWREGQMEILVDGLFLSAKDFMDRSLKSFKQLVQPCEAGLNLCREALARVGQKIAVAKCKKLEACLITETAKASAHTSA